MTQTDEAKAWDLNADALAERAISLFVNRTDIYGAYKPLHRRDTGSAWTAPFKADRGKIFLSPTVLAKHFRGRRVEHLVGCHAISQTDTCRWFAIDIDQHRDSVGVDVVRRNSEIAIHLGALLSTMGLSSVIEDSNGRGGMHVWCFLARALPAPEVYDFCRALIGSADLPPDTESFPKQPSARRAFGNWLRLPGRHHDGRLHWSRFWSGSEWLKGNDAVRYLLDAD